MMRRVERCGMTDACFLFVVHAACALRYQVSRKFSLLEKYKAKCRVWSGKDRYVQNVRAGNAWMAKIAD